MRWSELFEDNLHQLAMKLDDDGLDYVQIVGTDWLVHFSGYSEEISRDGFTKGTPLSHQGWKGAWGSNSKTPGFNFAVSAHEENAIDFWSEHCASAVVFRAAGVECYHKDGFDQVIFWGPSVERPIYWIETLDDGPWSSTADEGQWTIKGINGKPVDGQPVGDLWSILIKIMHP